MINILLKTTLSNIMIDYGYNNLIISNKELYRKLYYSPFEELIISKNFEEISTTKVNVLKNILDFDLNEKKSLTELYKYMDKNISGNYKEEKYELYSTIAKFMDFILDNDQKNLEYSIEVDLNKFLQAIDLRYATSDNLIENMVNYIEHTSNKSSLTITYNLNTFLDENEIILFNEELTKRQLIVLDLSSTTINSLTKLIIDKDMCII